LGVFYGLSALVKLLRSGMSWPNGQSLQLWVMVFGANPDCLESQLILSNRTIAALLQLLTLLGEAAALPAIFYPKIRPSVGLVLIGFHFASMRVFHFPFIYNTILLGLFFFPSYLWVTELASHVQSRISP